MKHTQKIINNIINNNNKSEIIKDIIINNKTIDNDQFAEAFNSYFSNISTNLEN